MPNTSITLSGNLQAYNHLTNNLVGDNKEQLEKWHKYLYLSRLSDTDVCDIVHFLLGNYWKNTEFNYPDSKFAYYPFSEKTITYLYAKHEMNLRSTLISLHDVISKFRENDEIIDLSDPIRAIAELNIIHDPLRLPVSIQKDFYQYLVSDLIQDKTRAREPENALYKLMNVVMKHTNYISELEQSKSRPNSGRQPDIYFRLGGNLFHQDSRRIAIEVKCYRKGTVVPKVDVEKTIELLEKNDVEYVTWITNVPLHQQTIDTVTEEIKSRHLRISPLTEEEMAYLYWATIFEKALDKEMSLEEAFELLEKVGVPSFLVKGPEELLRIENIRSMGGETEKDPILDDDKPSGHVGFDLEKKMISFINDHITHLKKKGRKQIRKIDMYSEFLQSKSISQNELPEAEFVEVVETLKKNGTFTTTMKLIKIS